MQVCVVSQKQRNVLKCYISHRITIILLKNCVKTIFGTFAKTSIEHFHSNVRETTLYKYVLTNELILKNNTLRLLRNRRILDNRIQLSLNFNFRIIGFAFLIVTQHNIPIFTSPYNYYQHIAHLLH